jgi:hypothetical protein
VKSTTSNADIISPKANPHYCNYDNCLSNQFLLFRSSPNSRALWEKLIVSFSDILSDIIGLPLDTKLPIHQYDMKIFDLLIAQKYAAISVFFLDDTLYQAYYTYSMHINSNLRSFFNLDNDSVYHLKSSIAYRDIEDKIRNAVSTGVWFLNDNHVSCAP